MLLVVLAIVIQVGILLVILKVILIAILMVILIVLLIAIVILRVVLLAIVVVLVLQIKSSTNSKTNIIGTPFLTFPGKAGRCTEAPETSTTGHEASLGPQNTHSQHRKWKFQGKHIRTTSEGL